MDLLAKKLSVKERKALLAQLIELNVQLGYDIKHLIGIQLSTLNFEKIKELIKEKEKKLEKI